MSYIPKKLKIREFLQTNDKQIIFPEEFKTFFVFVLTIEAIKYVACTPLRHYVNESRTAPIFDFVKKEVFCGNIVLKMGSLLSST